MNVSKKNILFSLAAVFYIALSSISCSVLNLNSGTGISITLPSIAVSRGTYSKDDAKSFRVEIKNEINVLVNETINLEETKNTPSKFYEVEAGTYTVTVFADNEKN